MTETSKANVPAFQRGDLVRIARDLGEDMSHFKADCEAIVLKASSARDDETKYALYLKGNGHSSWYLEHQLTLVEHGREDKIKEWRDEYAAEWKQKSDLDWIFANGKDVIEHPHEASVEALENCFGPTNVWIKGVYYSNFMNALELATEFLRTGDKDGWLARSKELVAQKELDLRLRRVAALQALGTSEGVTHTFWRLATAAVQAAGGNAQLVDWRAVEDATITECIEENAHPPESIRDALRLHSPGVVFGSQQAELWDRIQTISLALSEQRETPKG